MPYPIVNPSGSIYYTSKISATSLYWYSGYELPVFPSLDDINCNSETCIPHCKSVELLSATVFWALASLFLLLSVSICQRRCILSVSFSVPAAICLHLSVCASLHFRLFLSSSLFFVYWPRKATNFKIATLFLSLSMRPVREEARRY